MNTSIVIVLFAVLFVALIGVVLMLSLSKKGVSERKVNSNARERTLDDFLEEALSFKGQALQELIESFISTHKLPYRQGEALSAEAKKRLEFVRNVASNPNATAKHISFLNRELVKRYGTYKMDIEAYEKLGIEERKKR